MSVLAVRPIGESAASKSFLMVESCATKVVASIGAVVEDVHAAEHRIGRQRGRYRAIAGRFVLGCCDLHISHFDVERLGSTSFKDVPIASAAKERIKGQTGQDQAQDQQEGDGACRR